MICEKKIRSTNCLKAHLLCRLANEYEEKFTSNVNFWSRPPVSLNFSLGPGFHEAAFYSSGRHGLFPLLSHFRIIDNS